MKLISCYVENFGGISRREYKFNGGLTVFCGDNGAGKTTLAEFLKALFYGLPSVRSGGAGYNARQRYYPFSGGRFGGNAVFEAQGKVWRIERFFDKKSEARDETAIYCGGNLIKVPAENLGKYFFGLNESSFERTAFFNAEAAEAAADGDIGEKLGGAMRALDGANADEAITEIEKRKRIIKAARGAGGLIDRKKAERASLCDEAARLRQAEQNLAAKYACRAETELQKDNYTPAYTANKGGNGAITAFLVAAAALIAGGAGVCAINVWAGLALLASGVCCIIVAIVFSRKKPAKTQDITGATDVAEVYRRLAEIDLSISADENELARLPEVLSAVEKAEAEISRLSYRYEVLSAAAQYLTQAKNGLSDRYAKPVRDGFLSYLAKIKMPVSGSVTLTDGLEIIYESGGSIRGAKHLSAGQRCACNLCLRLALIDNMYPQDKPFLILDDPFISLDGKNFGGAAEVVRALSGHVQIIYFTCHQSRAV